MVRLFTMRANIRLVLTDANKIARLETYEEAAVARVRELGRDFFGKRRSFFVGLFVVGISQTSLGNSINFSVKNLKFTVTAFDGNPPLFSESAFGSADFQWNYTAGDFANGTGTLTSLDLPYTTFYPWQKGIYSVDSTGITGTNPGNYQNLTYDFAINFTGLTPNGCGISSGSFNFTGYDGFFNGEYSGTVSGGTVAPAVPEPLSMICIGIGSVILLSRRRSKK